MNELLLHWRRRLLAKRVWLWQPIRGVIRGLQIGGGGGVFKILNSTPYTVEIRPAQPDRNVVDSTHRDFPEGNRQSANEQVRKPQSQAYC